MRQIRMASHTLQDIALSMHGTAGHLAADGTADVATIRAAADALVEAADDMEEYARQTVSTVALTNEPIDLAFVLDTAMSGVTTAAVGQREWQAAPELAPARLMGDVRALRHVLTRGLTFVLHATDPEAGSKFGWSGGVTRWHW